MRFDECSEFLRSLFLAEKLDRAPDEWAIRVNGCEEIQRIAYTTNLTPTVVRDGALAGADLLLTHHDAWDFLFGMKAACLREMEAVRLAHAFFHLPLDDADFGTNATFLAELGATEVAKTHREAEIFLCGRVGAYDPPIEFDELVRRVEAVMGHPARSWRNHDRLIGRIGFVSGGGLNTNDVQEAVENECDAYITGEQTLYTVLHARNVEIDLIIGSHTHTELGGVRSLAEKIHEAFPDVEILPIAEGFFE